MRYFHRIWQPGRHRAISEFGNRLIVGFVTRNMIFDKIQDGDWRRFMLSECFLVFYLLINLFKREIAHKSSCDLAIRPIIYKSRPTWTWKNEGLRWIISCEYKSVAWSDALTKQIGTIGRVRIAKSIATPYPILFRLNFFGVPFGVDPSCWGLQRAKRLG